MAMFTMGPAAAKGISRNSKASLGTPNASPKVGMKASGSRTAVMTRTACVQRRAPELALGPELDL